MGSIQAGHCRALQRREEEQRHLRSNHVASVQASPLTLPLSRLARSWSGHQGYRTITIPQRQGILRG